MRMLCTLTIPTLSILRRSWSFELPQAGMAELTIYDLLGRKIKTLVQENLPAGHYEIIWEARMSLDKQLPAGCICIV